MALTLAALSVRPAVGEAWNRRSLLTTLALDRALLDLAGLALLGCIAWAWLALTVTVLEALRGVADDARGTQLLRLPGGVRRLVLAGCGVALASGLAPSAALAADGATDGAVHGTIHGTIHGAIHGAIPGTAGRSDHRHVDSGLALLVGLPLPDRAVLPTTAHGPRATHRAAGASTVRSERSVVVGPGDCLWSIAEGDLPRGASSTAVAIRWQEIYAANRALIGPDPDLLQPGQRLLLPPRSDAAQPDPRQPGAARPDAARPDAASSQTVEPHPATPRSREDPS